MTSDELDPHVRTRAVLLPEEHAAQDGGDPDRGPDPVADRDEDHRAPVADRDEDHRAQAGAILRESQDRIAAASAGDRPADAATEHRRSEDTAS